MNIKNSKIMSCVSMSSVAIELIQLIQEDDPKVIVTDDFKSKYQQDFSNEEWGKIAEALGGSKHVKELWLYGYSYSIRKPMDNIATAHLFTMLGSNTSIQHLALSGNRLTDTSVEILARMLVKNRTLKSLRLPYNSITDKGVVALSYALTRNSSLTECDLTLNAFDIDGWKALLKALEVNTGICKLTIAKVSLTDQLVESIAHMLQRNCAIRTLTIVTRSVSLQPATMQLLQKALSQNSTITHLVVNIDFIGSGIMEYLTKCFQPPCSIKRLSVDNTRCYTSNSNWEVYENLSRWLLSLGQNCGLTCLKLQNCRISSEQAIFLCQTLTLNCSLETLDLSYNDDMGTSGIEALSNLLTVNTSIRVLALYVNRICVLHLHILAKMLAMNRSLATLDLSGNSIHFPDSYCEENLWDKAAGYFTDFCFAVCNHPSLSALYLNQCCLGNEGANTLAKHLQANNSLQILELKVNSISNTDALVLALQNNWSLQSLTLVGNPILLVGLESLVQVLLKVNTTVTQLDIVCTVAQESITAAGHGEEMNALFNSANLYLQRNLKLLHNRIETELDPVLGIKGLSQIVCQYCDTNLP
jgi:Ran GTPase-activating protein (RanGAP) involved in mRNA processing and transport